jgi:hypothetical protein
MFDEIAFLKGPNVTEALAYLASKRLSSTNGRTTLKKLRRAQRIAAGDRPVSIKGRTKKKKSV